MEKELRHLYLGQIGHLLAISKWSEDRQVTSNCSQDLDWDNEPECLLASETLAAVIDLQGGYISFAFSFYEGEYHQIIGPSFQLATGLSDPITWKLDQGIVADSSIIPGAFTSMDDKWKRFRLIKADSGTLTSRRDRKFEKYSG
jgi:hypothetical protein